MTVDPNTPCTTHHQSIPVLIPNFANALCSLLKIEFCTVVHHFGASKNTTCLKFISGLGSRIATVEPLAQQIDEQI